MVQYYYHKNTSLPSESNLIEKILDARMVPQSPTKVCIRCYDEADADDNTRWLPWLECARPDDHANEERITVIVSDGHKVLEVADIPPSLLGQQHTQIRLCSQECKNGKSCNNAHSYEELEYWKWCYVQQLLGKVYYMQ